MIEVPSGTLRSELADIVPMAADFVTDRRASPVVDGIDPRMIRKRLQKYCFDRPLSVLDVAKDVFDLLGGHAVRSDHPRYFGLFNPPTLPAAVIGDLIAAVVNPQLAVWGHAPAAAEIERKLLDLFGTCIGWPAGETAGTFTSGGSEANLTAVVAALARRYPEWREGGLSRMAARPAIYVSREAHLAWIKIARVTGLGSEAVRLVAPGNGLVLRGEELAAAIAEDCTSHWDPALIVATAGTTAHGAVDDLETIAAVAREYGAHFHVDAAWAGAAVLSDRGRAALAGIDAADSVTIDPHKWLCVPMAAGMYLGREWTLLANAFDVSTSYMPSSSRGQRDPYVHSMQWSRRFTGLKLFMAMATLGRSGYASLIEGMLETGEYLRHRLREDGWRIQNNTRFPLVCFTLDGRKDEAVSDIASTVVASGNAWLSTVRLRGRLVLRACITSYETTAEDVDLLVEALNDARG